MSNTGQGQLQGQPPGVGEKEKSSRKLVAIIAVVIVAVAIIGVVILLQQQNQQSSQSTSGGQTKPQTIVSGPLQVSSISVEKTNACLKTLVIEFNSGGTTCRGYNIATVRSGLQGYLVSFKFSNTGSETYGVTFVLITSKGRQLGFLQALQGSDRGIDVTLGVSDCHASDEDKALLNRCVEIPQDTFNILTTNTIVTLSPGASIDVKLLYGLQPDESPLKVHVIARSILGTTLEFDIPLS